MTAVLIFSTAGSVVYAEEQLTDEEYIEIVLSQMSLKEKIAQMLFVYVPEKDAYKKQKQYQYGGYVMFARDFSDSTPKKVKSRINSWQKASKINMMIAVDEEGGSVVRVSKYKKFRSKPYKSSRKLKELGGYDLIEQDASNKSNLLKKLGINTNFAPVADVPYSSKNFIYNRSFSTNAKKTAKYIHTVVPMMKKRKVVATLKHFPGYGGNGDSHQKVIKDKRSLKTFEKRDLLPFQQGIKDGAPMIMVTHNVVKAFDSKHPASMSKKVHNYLRKTLKFDGIIITDGLDMKGVVDKFGSREEVAVRAVIAGNDMLCTPYGKTSLYAIRDAVKRGDITEKRINASVRRILKIKLKYGIIQKDNSVKKPETTTVPALAAPTKKEK